ncbi:MAG: peptide chain release factor N(5)-glutamine methyltransferase [Lutibacter sp.]|nr:peptide chain release factor N(5)-glutamine methyltransferase [Lutibacter sp.]MDP3314203.1 peptide chain release factor N(5)-glutamine methyltransferase [Lutibacter sp.]
MRISEFKKHFFLELSMLYPETEIQSFFNLLIEYTLKISRIDLALQPNLEFNKTELSFFNNALNNLKEHIPIQYIIGETEFYGLKFNVNKNVLIPRPETEELIRWILDNLKLKTQNPKLKILDIGTGSGCIAISLALNLPNAEVFAIDISKKALETAKSNAKRNGVSINFIELDILKSKSLPDYFDIIVSNPPYVREVEKKEMQQNVLNFEPHLALFVKNENPLIFFDKIADLAQNYLNKNGHLYFEINQYLGKETCELLEKKGFKNIELKKDIYNVDRMIKSLKL